MVKTKSKSQPNKRNLPCIKTRQFHFPAQTASISQMLHSYPSGRQAGTTVGVPSSTTATDLEETHLLPVTPNYNPVPHVLHVLNPLWRQLSLGPYSSTVLLQLTQLTHFLRLCLCAFHTPSASFSLTIC